MSVAAVFLIVVGVAYGVWVTHGMGKAYDVLRARGEHDERELKNGAILTTAVLLFAGGLALLALRGLLLLLGVVV